MVVNAVNSFSSVNNLPKTTEIKKQNLNFNSINFKGEDTIELDKKVETTKKSNTGKKWGVGIASFILPGLGQAANGQWGKAAGFLFGPFVLSGLSVFALAPSVAISLTILLHAGARAWSIIDAVKSVE